MEPITYSLLMCLVVLALTAQIGDTDKINIIKQLLDEVEYDIMNYQNLVSVLSASAFGFGR